MIPEYNTMEYEKITRELTDDELGNVEYVEKILLEGNPARLRQVVDKYKLTKEQLEAFMYYTKLRQDILEQMSQETAARIDSIPIATIEESAMGAYLENIEPQVRPAVIKMRAKGYNTFSSGFVMPNHRQTIEFTDASLNGYTPSEHLDKYLKEKGVELEIEDTAISFKTLKKLSEDELKEVWSEISADLPYLGHQAPPSNFPQDEIFRKKQEELIG